MMHDAFNKNNFLHIFFLCVRSMYDVIWHFVHELYRKIRRFLAWTQMNRSDYDWTMLYILYMRTNELYVLCAQYQLSSKIFKRNKFRNWSHITMLWVSFLLLHFYFSFVVVVGILKLEYRSWATQFRYDFINFQVEMNV